MLSELPAIAPAHTCALFSMNDLRLGIHYLQGFRSRYLLSNLVSPDKGFTFTRFARLLI
jgi:hypothetical protein